MTTLAVLAFVARAHLRMSADEPTSWSHVSADGSRKVHGSGRMREGAHMSASHMQLTRVVLQNANVTFYKLAADPHCHGSNSVKSAIDELQRLDRFRFVKDTIFKPKDWRKMVDAYVIGFQDDPKRSKIDAHLRALGLEYSACEGVHATLAGWEALKQRGAVMRDAPYPRNSGCRTHWAKRCGDVGNVMAHLSCMKKAYDVWVHDGSPPRFVYIQEDDEFVSERGFELAATLMDKSHNEVDVMMFNTLRSDGKQVLPDWFALDPGRKCPGDRFDNGECLMENTWSNAAQLLNPMDIPALLQIAERFYGKDSKWNVPFDKFISTFYAAASSSLQIFGAYTNNISNHVEAGNSERKSSKFNCDQ